MPPQIVKPALLYLALIALMLAVAVNCSGVDCKDPKNAATASCVAERVLEDCTASSWTDAIAKYGPQVADIIHGATKNPDGSINWSSIDGPLVTAAATFGQCVVADVFGKIIFGKKSVLVGSGANVATPASARQEFEDLRAKHFPSKSFKTAGGTL